MKKSLIKVCSFLLILAVFFSIPFLVKNKEESKASATEDTTMQELIATYGTGASEYGRETKGSIVVKEGSTYTMTGGVMANQSARFGSAFYVEAGGTLNISGGTFYCNASKYGAIYVEAGGILNISGAVDFVGNTTEMTNVDYNGQDLPIYMEDKESLVGGSQPLTFAGGVQIKSSLDIEVYDFELLLHLDDGYVARTYCDKDAELEEVTQKILDLKDSAGDSYINFEAVNGLFTDADACLDVLEPEKRGEYGIIPVYSKTATVDAFEYDGNKATAKSSASGELILPAVYNGTPITTFDCYGKTDVTGITLGQNINEVYQSSVFCTLINELNITSNVTAFHPYEYDEVFDMRKEQLRNYIGAVFVSDYNDNFSDHNVYGLFNKDGSKLLFGGSVMYNYSHLIPSALQELGPCAFLGSEINAFECNTLQSVGYNAFTYSDLRMYDTTAKSFGSSVFWGTSLNGGIHLPKGVDIPERFLDGVTLQGIAIPEEAILHRSSLAGISGLQFVYIPGTVTFEEKITSAPASGTGNDGIFGYSQFGSMYTDVVTDLSESEAKSQWGDYFNYYNSELDTCYHLIGDYNAGNAYITGSSEDISGVVTLPKYAMSIGNGAFQGRTNITEVTTISLYESILIKVGDNAFNGCTGLSKVTLPESVEVIGASAFAGTTSLSEINTSTCKISQVYENAFEGSGLGNIMFNDSLQTIKTAAFKNSKLGRIEQIDNITIINASVFEGCTYLFSVPFDNILTIGNSAFKGCTALGNFSYNKVTSIGSSAFEGCTGMTYITLGTSLKTIGANAFKGCSNLVEIELLGNNLTTIGDSAFYGCSSMTSFTVTEAVTSLDGAFTGAYFSSVTFKNATIGTQTFKEFAGTTLSLNLANSTITTFTDGLFEGAKITSFTIPTQITRLEGSVFKSCTKLTSLYIPNSVATITIVTTNQGLVYGCSVQNLTVYAEATTEPSGWDNDWRLMSSNNSLVSVSWGAYVS